MMSKSPAGPKRSARTALTLFVSLVLALTIVSSAPGQRMRLTATQRPIAPSGLLTSTVGIYLAADNKGNLFVLNQSNNQVSELSPSGGGYVATNLFALPAIGTGFGCGIGVDNNGVVRAVDCMTHNMYEYNLATGVLTKHFGDGFGFQYSGETFAGSSDGYMYEVEGETYYDTIGRNELQTNGSYRLHYAFSNNNSIQDIVIDRLAADHKGNIYYLHASSNSGTDYNRTVSKLTPVAGGQNYAHQDLAQINNFRNGFAVADDGTIYGHGYGDTSVTVIGIDADGNVVPSTIGSGLVGHYNVAPNLGSSLAVDPAKNVFVIDGSSILEISAASTSATLPPAPVGLSSSMQLSYSFSASTTINKIQVTLDGVVSPELTASTTGCTTGFAYATRTGSGSTAVTSTDNCALSLTFTPSTPGWLKGAVTFFDSNGLVLASTAILAQGTGPQLVSAQSPNPISIGSGMNAPRKMAIDGSGNVYIADTGNNRILLETRTNYYTYVQSVFASGFSQPSGVGVDGAGNVYVTDLGTHSLIELNKKADGTYGRSTIDNNFVQPADLVVDLAGNVYVSDAASRVVVKEAANGNGGFSTTTLPITAHNFGPIAVDSGLNLYTTSTTNSQVYKEVLQADGSYVEVAYYSGGNIPEGLFVDRNDNLYVSDTGNNRVVEVSPADGSATVIKTGLTGPWDTVADPWGSVYFLNTGANALQKLDYADQAISMVFADTSVGASAQQSAHVMNIGNLPLIYTSLATATASFGLASHSPTCSTTTPMTVNGDCWLSVNFTPQSVGPLTDSLTLTYTSSNAATATLALALNGNGLGATQTITFTPAPGAVGSTVTLTATASSGLPVTFSIASGGTGAATISGNQITYTALGTVLIKATQAGNANYLGASTIAEVTVGGAPTLVGATSSAGTITFYNPYQKNSSTLGTPAATALTQGVPNADFKIVSGGTCTNGGTVPALSNCTVKYTFTPSSPGEHLGAVYINSTNGIPLFITPYEGAGTAPVSGLGVGPLAVFPQNAQATNIATGLTAARGITVDSFGNLYLSNTSSKKVLKYPVGSTTATTLADLSSTSGITYTSGTTLDGSGHLFFGTNTGLYYVNADGSGGPHAIQLYVLNQYHGGDLLPVNVDNNLSLDGASNLYFSDEATGAIYSMPSNDVFGAGAAFPTLLVAGGAGHRFVGMAVDANGNVFAADYSNSILYELKAGSTSLTTLFSGAPLVHPHAVTLDAAGNVYVTNYNATGAGAIYRFQAGNYTSTPTALPTTGSQSVAIGSDGSIYAMTSDSTLVRYPRTAPAVSLPSTAVGAQSAYTPSVLENDGNATLNITSVAISGTDFRLDPASTCTTAATVSVNSTCTIGVGFAPQQGGATSGTVSITDNSFTGPGAAQNITLSGTATATATSLSLGAAPFGGDVSQPITLTATLTPNATASVNATGMITFKSGTTTIGTATLNAGIATVTIANPRVGASSYSAVYTGDTTFQTSTSNTLQNMVKTISTIVTIGISPTPSNSSQSTTITATLVPSAVASFLTNGETVTFKSGGTAIGTGALASGVATLTTTLPIGVNSLTAVYGGDAYFSASASAPLSLTLRGVTLFIANAGGTMTSYFTAGSMQTSQTGGGIGAAVDNSGNVWSIQSKGSGVSVFRDTGILRSNYTPTGLTAGKALTIDGNNVVWIANTDGSVIPVASTGVASAAILPADANAAPGSISVDTAGSLWIPIPSNNSVIEVIGAAAPVTAPIVTQTTSASPGVRP